MHKRDGLGWSRMESLRLAWEGGWIDYAVVKPCGRWRLSSPSVDVHRSIGRIWILSWGRHDQLIHFPMNITGH